MNDFRIHLSLALLVLAGPAWPAEPLAEHTYSLEADGTRPDATLEDARWLVGSWAGTAFGENFEQVWNPPSAGTMIGLFKLYSDEGISFYELLELSEQDGTLTMKVKHFDADFFAWEEKEDFVNFRLVKMDDDALHFGGLSFYRRDNGSIDGYIAMRNDEVVTEHHLTYVRQ